MVKPEAIPKKVSKASEKTTCSTTTTFLEGGKRDIAIEERRRHEEELEKRGLEDEDFLRLDQSKVPLELFDNSDFEKFSPQEWLERCTSGRSRLYMDGEWTWAPCDILSYDPARLQYEIVFRCNGKSKWVKRLNLIFDAEHEPTFWERLQTCTDLRELSKAMVRLEYFASRQDAEEIAPLSEPVWEQIYHLATARLERQQHEIDLPHTYEQAKLALTRGLVEDVDLLYVSTMQKIILREVSRRDEETRQRMQELKLPPFPARQPAPRYGKLQLPPETTDYTNAHDVISHAHWSGTSGMAVTVSWLEDTWRDEFGRALMIDTSLADPASKNAFSLTDFVDRQVEHCSHLALRLQRNWWQGVANNMLDNLASDYNFYENDLEVIRTSDTAKVLLRFQIQMAFQLQELVLRSLHEWSRIFNSASKNPALRDTAAFLRVELHEVDEAITVTPSFDEVADAAQAVVDKVIAAVRGLNTVDHELLSLHELTPKPLLYIDDPVRVNESESPMVAKVNACLKKVRGEVAAFLRADFDTTLRIAASYDRYLQLLREDPETHVEAFAQPKLVSKKELKAQQLAAEAAAAAAEEEGGDAENGDEASGSAPSDKANNDGPKTSGGDDDGDDEDEEGEEEEEAEEEEESDELVEVPISREEFRAEIAKFHEAMHAVMVETYHEEVCGSFLLQTVSIKEEIAARAKEQIDAFADYLLEIQNDRAEALTEEYERILQRIATKPKNEIELVDLEEFIEDAKVRMEGLADAVADVHSWNEMLEEFGCQIPAEAFQLSWSLKLWPNRILAAQAATMRALEVDKVAMIETLAREKEEFDRALDQYTLEVEAFEKHDDYEKLHDIVSEAYSIEEKLNQAAEQIANFNLRDRAFGFDTGDYPTLDLCKKQFDPFFQLWTMSADFISSTKEWLTGPFSDVNGDEVEKQVTEWWTTSYRLMKTFGSDNEGAAEIAGRLRQDSDAFKSYMPLIRALASPALRERHWNALGELIQEEISPNDLTLQRLIDLNIMDRMEEVETITVKAEKEFALEKNIEAMAAEWNGIDFSTMEYKNTGTFVIKGTDDVIALLDDHIVKIQTMVGSPYIKPIKHKAIQWEKRLMYIQTLIDEMLKCQRAWMYLEPIFGSDDIMRQMPTEGRRFNSVDGVWRKVLGKINESPSVMNTTNDDTLVDRFKQANERLDQIQKGLNDYLEVKRMSFARFFFLSNDELLEIVSQTKDPQAVQPFLQKCFEGVGQVVFGKDMVPPEEQNPPRGEPFIVGGSDDLRIPRLVSNEGEIVDLSIVVDPNSGPNKGNVELWLSDFEMSMRITVKEILQAAASEYPVMENLDVNPERAKWVISWPGQVVLNASQLFWTKEVTTAIKAGRLEHYTEQLNQQLLQIVHLVRGKLSKMERTTLGALSVIDVHQRDVVAEMAEKGVSDPNEFEWMAQLRYYWELHDDDFGRYGKDPNNMVVRILNATQLYAYEYLGNSSRLIITPLTDRCYRTLMGAVSLLYGGAPAGPAGTGKTETTKDLSKAIAKQCVVFNCSDGLDYLAMAKFFKGIAQAGAWACFDEFNRIELEVLSVIAQQILTIVKAKRARAKRFDFEGSTLTLNPDANSFITMNPGYAGRQELPDNLQALFRPCAMMVPDYALIAEIKLFSFGFADNRNLARKLTQVLILCSEQLSSQKHYDYGMRAVFSILVRAGKLRQDLGDVWTEAMIVLSAVTDVNLPKFNTADIPLFKGITSDLFPGVELPTPDYRTLMQAIRDVCEDDNLQPDEPFLRAVIQLYETVMVRHGLMVVGETFSGKTCVTHTLAKAMSRIQDDPKFEGTVRIHTMNPKSITQGQLYGSFDENTHEWTDGILAVTYRNASKDTTEDRQWIMFDGPVDAVWIEDMNTVLDDNKKLCLQSGEIVKMSARMTMMFEPEDLEEASPATVSRVGMVFLEQKRLGWRPLVRSWVNRMPLLLAECGAPTEVMTLFEAYFEPFVFQLRDVCAIPTPITDSELCASVLRLMSSTLFDPFQPANTKDKEPPKDPLRVVEGAFLFALIWAVGGVTDERGRQILDNYLKRLITGMMEGQPAWEQFVLKNPAYKDAMNEPRELRTPMPFDQGSIFDYVFFCDKGLWTPWMDITPRFMPGSDTQYQDILVPTVDTTRNEWIIQRLVEHTQPVLVTGSTGTGKTVSVQNVLLKALDQNVYKPMFINFSAQTSANQTQDIIDGKLDKRRKGIFGPPIGKRIVIMVDDLNMPAKEVYGAQPPIEILRQYMDHTGWYDRKEKTFRKLIDIQFVAAMGPPGGGRTQITQRYVRHYSMLNLLPFEASSLAVIFGTIMEWFAKPFGPKIKAVVPSVVSSTIALYKQIAEDMLPTPAKSHYTFNLRDLSKVFQGICMGSADRIKETNQLVRIWGHECMRVFKDRLINEEDRSWFDEALGGKVSEHYSADWSKIAPRNRPLIYGNFIDPTQLVESRVYDELDDMATLKEVMEGYLVDYNNMSSKKMNLVLFMNAIEHVARISRVLCQPLGNALLVGVGGSGRKSLTTLAVSLNEQVLFQIEISKVYGMPEWHDDLRRMLKMAGVEGKQTVFLFADTQVVNEGFVEDINNILNTGEVPNLFNMEDQTEIVESVRPVAEKLGLELNTQAEVMQFFVKRCRQNLHVVLAFSPVGDSFRDRLRRFPSLVNCCAIDWFTEWPKDALLSVAHHFLSAIELDDALKTGIVDVCVDMQQRTSRMAERFLEEMGRYYYVTPTSYLELINTFKTLIEKQRTMISEKRSRYANGLQKLQETAEQVAEMRQELEALQPKLVIAQKETDAKLEMVQGKQKEADQQKEIVQRDEAQAKEQAASCEKDKAECEEMLAEAIPALEGAVKALSTLSKNDITEVKSLKTPPAGVKLTLEAVCIMMGVKPRKVPNPNGKGKVDDYWEPAKKELLNDPRFLQRLVEYDKDNISEEVINKVKPFCERDDFRPEVIKKSSVAAAGLCKWVHAMVVYERIARVVAPKRAALAKANADLAEAMGMLQAKQAELQAVLDNLQMLQNELQDTMDKKEALEQQVADCATKLDRASRLIGGLGGEKTRWTQFVADLGVQYENAVGDILLSSGVIAYLGVFTQSYRSSCIEEWASQLAQNSIPSTEPFSLNQTLGEPVKIRAWTIAKLPNDGFSIDNAIMLYASNRWPLMIDPQGQANRWVRNVEADNGLKVIKQTQSDFVRNLENAISFGLPVLLENVGENLDPILEPVLTKQIVNKGGSKTMQLGDNIVEYDDRFRFYMTTKLRNPHYSPETVVKVTLINFVANEEGLKDQMLGITVRRETPELEAQREQLVVEDAENKRILKELEDKILELLAKAEGNILDDEVLINTLSESKATSDQIMKQVAIAEKTAIKINNTRAGYVPVAKVSSNLFFCVADLAGVDPMYQFSLDWYANLYNLAIDRAAKGSNLNDRLKALTDTFAEILYDNVCRSLFEKDKLLFSFLLCIKMLQLRDEMDPGELRFFLTGSTAVDLSRPNPDSENSFLSDKCWADLLALHDIPNGVFPHFHEEVESELSFWESVSNAQDPLQLIREKYSERFDQFQQLLLLRCIRLDKVVPALMEFIMAKIGQRFIEPPPFDLGAGYRDSSCTTPLLFVLTPGADAMTELIRVAEELGMDQKLYSVSMGQGQGPIAERSIAEAVDKGGWVALENLHVMPSWFEMLEKIVEDLHPDVVHEDFRLWLTALPCKEFPVSVLQNGIKMTLEPPKGLRANLKGSYAALDRDWFDSCLKPEAFHKMCFGIAFLHALVRERCKFGPLGWNIPYEFSASDQRISLDQLHLFLNEYEQIPWAMLHYLTSSCNYGGRVTDDKDRRCLDTIVADFYKPPILEDSHRFSPSGIYFAPPDGDMDSYLEYINQLPFTEMPEVFGLHENAEITTAITSTNALMVAALELQPRTSGGEGMSWAEQLNELSSDIEKRIPDLFDLEVAAVRFPVLYEESMNSTLRQELERFNNLLAVVKRSLKDVQLAIRGLVVMSSELEAMGNSMTNMLVPEMWSRAAYPSLKPLSSWVNDLLDRLSFFNKWLDDGTPAVVVISYLFWIPGFTTGVRQNFARKHKVAIDLIKYTNEVLPRDMDCSARLDDGHYITGLHLQGAGWEDEGRVLVDSRPKELFVAMPCIKLLPTEVSQIVATDDYECPVYKTSERRGVLATTGHSSNFVMFLNLPVRDQPAPFWIKRGVAMLCALDD
ncbi:Dynein heavy chain 7, axonemal [Hondaea fermentalgiana]|uniref:Dynein heavy chain 7, axonemal n=1 Tax=Hondaea fermentalgiana TaxID=2315210 RepID=A0A2R5GMV2_9STRA|nr:Dynein heavy chain 7, axonemal [Hondaea fermentalgiana]|eukprot:GBG29641.1 Dynein heavy chain 7, axonemal [Hondaea fermentalgiana]